MNIAYCVVTATPALCEEAIRLARSNQTGDAVTYYVYANACKVPGATVESPTNDGVVGPMHELFLRTTEDIVIFNHDDLEMYEKGWDQRVIQRFTESPECVVAAWGGAETCGDPEMWTNGSDYEPTRGPFMSNLTVLPGRKEMTPAEVHGPRITKDCRAVTLDGFGFAVRRTFLEQLGGWKWWPIVNHGYDVALACQVARAKKELWIVPLKIGHPWVGRTSQAKAGAEFAGKHGGNYGVYLKSFAMVREMFRDVLPLAMPGATHVKVPQPQMMKDIVDTYFGLVKVSALPESPAAEWSLNLLKKVLTGTFTEDGSVHPGLPPQYDARTRELGLDWPATAHTMVGLKRLDNFQKCIEDTIARDIPGDIIETGVWRGGASILARGVLKAHGCVGRQVWVADSFQGLPPPEWSQDAGSVFHVPKVLAVSLESVKANFEKYGLLDDQVTFLPGWFKDTLHKAPIHRLAVLRLDGDMYQSTMEALEALYPKLSRGGYCIIDDYHIVPTCKQAVTDYRAKHGMKEPLVEIDGSGVFWRKEKTWFVAPVVQRKVTLVIPTLTELGALRAHTLIKKALEGSRPPDRVFVIDNGGYFRDPLDVVDICTPPKNLGVAASWNLALERFPDDWLIFANDDVTLASTSIADFVRAAETTEKVLITCKEGQGFPFFLLKKNPVGKFDEQFYPAYYEDTDYLHRLAKAGLGVMRIDGGIKHGPGGTTAKEAGMKIEVIAGENLARYVAKWGGPPGREGRGTKPVKPGALRPREPAPPPPPRAPRAPRVLPTNISKQALTTTKP